MRVFDGNVVLLRLIPGFKAQFLKWGWTAIRDFRVHFMRGGEVEVGSYTQECPAEATRGYLQNWLGDGADSSGIGGRLRSEVKCCECAGGKWRGVSQPHETTFDVPIAHSGGSVRSLWRQFRRRERVDGENSIACEDCGARTAHYKRFRVVDAGDRVIVTLKRFEWSDRVRGMEKIDAHVEPSAMLKVGKQRFGLRGLVEHQGADGAGHCIAYVRFGARGGWWKCNSSQPDKEERITAATWPEVKRAEAYVLLYRRL